MANGKKRIMILGGGCGGIAAAFWLTSTPALRNQHDITIYTRGWRLGGKGASGRSQPNNNRIEEHGLHMWMGSYENAFRTIKGCYSEWQPRPDCPLKTWDTAFKEQRLITLQQLQEDSGEETWIPWHFQFPQSAGSPGDGTPLTFVDLVLRLADWLQFELEQLEKISPSLHFADLRATIEKIRRAARKPTDSDLAREAAADLDKLAAQLRASFDNLVQNRTPVGSRFRPVNDVMDGSLRCSPTVTQFAVLAILGIAMSKGILLDVLPFGYEGFKRINGLDFREWLLSHGALQECVTSAVVRSLYDLGFAYPGGDTSDFANGKGAAGAAARFILEMGLGYKDAPLWKMNAGMGDIVFTPLFQVLEQRGVKFKFFHHVENISTDATRVTSITLRRQADLLAKRYQPFVDVEHLDCWPNEPLWDQLVNGAQLKAEKPRPNFESIWDGHGKSLPPLLVDKDFDAVVLALPPAMIQQVAPDLTKNACWKAMLDNSASVITQAFQIWLNPTLPKLGWSCGPTVMTSYAPPFDTWADMTHLLQRESWPVPYAPGTIAYFCGAMPTPNPPLANPIEDGTALVTQNAEDWLVENAPRIWPGGNSSGSVISRFGGVSDYYRCNIDPSELYVQTLPGSVQFRLHPGRSNFGNLVLAGDWTLTRYSSGCVEAAIESGMLASKAICGEPASIHGHP